MSATCCAKSQDRKVRGRSWHVTYAPLGDAEDAIRRRGRAEAEHAASAARAQASGADQARSELIAEVEALVPEALEGLRAAGWPAGQLFYIPGFLRKKQIGGWPAGGFEYHHKDRAGTYIQPIHLLSDGRWMWWFSAKPTTFPTIVQSFAGTTERLGGRVCSDLPVGTVGALKGLAESSLSRHE